MGEIYNLLVAEEFTEVGQLREIGTIEDMRILLPGLSGESHMFIFVSCVAVKKS